jgi:hypothetical protein
MINLSEIKAKRDIKPPRIILYGTPKIGKTTFCANIKNVLFLDFEDGSSNLDVARVKREQLETYDDVINTLNALATQEHEFKALVIDSATKLEEIFQKQTGKEHGKEFSKIGFRRGEVRVASLWGDFLQRLDDLRDGLRMSIWIIGHDEKLKIDEPNVETYQQFSIDVCKESLSVLKPWADAIFFAEEEVGTREKTEGFTKKVMTYRGDRLLHTGRSPRYLAGNRWNLPETMPFEWDAFAEEYKQAIKQPTKE